MVPESLGQRVKGHTCSLFCVQMTEFNFASHSSKVGKYTSLQNRWFCTTNKHFKHGDKLTYLGVRTVDYIGPGTEDKC